MVSPTSKVVKETALKLGADLVGIASVERFEGAPKGWHPTDIVPGAKSVVSVGIRQLRSYMEKAPHTLYFMFGYRQKNDYINQICWSVARLLDEQGYYALPVQASQEGTLFVDNPALPERAERQHKRPSARIRGSFSHVYAAANAGMGQVGANGLLLTPQYGPRVHLGSIVTTAPLEPDPLLKEKLCDTAKCTLCIEQCPAKAISEKGDVDHILCVIALDKLSTGFDETLKEIVTRERETDALMRAALSVGYTDFNGIGFCGIPCVNACPVGKRNLR